MVSPVKGYACARGGTDSVECGDDEPDVHFEPLQQQGLAEWPVQLATITCCLRPGT